MLRFSCEKALLQSAVNTTSRAVAAKSSIPALEGILLEGGDTLTLSGYNMQTGIRTIVDAQVQSPGRIVLSARLFGEMIRKMPDDVIVFAADENLSVHLTCGDASFEILGLSADDYPELPEVDDQFSVDIRQGTLKAGLFQGIRIVFQVLLPMVTGPYIGAAVIRGTGMTYEDLGAVKQVPTAEIFLAAAAALVLLAIPAALLKRKETVK